MTEIFDTHTHFNDNIYKEHEIEVAEMIKEAGENGVTRFCCVGFDEKSSKQAVMYAIEFPNVYAAVGIHPNSVETSSQAEIDEIEVLSHGENVVAIGEIGLDYYYTNKTKELQKIFFKKQIEIALKNNLAVMIHLRDIDESENAYLDALEILDSHKVKKAIIHCYTRGFELAQKFTKRGYLISIPGVVTFKNAHDLHRTVKKLSLNEMLVETDAPYLTPEPKRGRLNTSKEIVHTIEKIANLRNIDKDDLIEATTSNALKIFNIN